MSILVIRGPDPDAVQGHAPAPLERAVLLMLLERAAMAGKTISVRTCGTEFEFVRALKGCRAARIEVALVDPGLCAGSAQVVRAIANLAVPYVEVHDDTGNRPEPCLPAGLGMRVGVASGYRGQSYMLALSMAIEHLHCEAQGWGAHAGT